MEDHRTLVEGNPDIIKVLMYHRVVKDRVLSKGHWTCIHAEDFRRHLEFLDRWGFTPITLNDYRLYLEGEINLPRKPVIITFDDGYLDTYENAFPLLQEFGMRAVVFVLGDRTIMSNAWDADGGISMAPLLEARHIVEMHRGGVEIGAHSLTHAKLVDLPRQRLWDEISRARMNLEILLNSPVWSFSYPFGLLNSVAKKMVQDAGYRFACSVYTGPSTFGMEAFEIRRIAIRSSTGILGFGIRMLTPYQHYEWIRRSVRERMISQEEHSQGNEQVEDQQRASI
jgi:peptidoglycan/xylan/chitin deacetylase (PgdA/CDA1 family)